jgi:transposase
VSQVSEPLSVAGDAVGLGVLLPHLAGLVVEETVIAGGLVCCRVRSGAGGAQCPGCGTWSGRVRDVYRRRLADAGIGGRRLVLLVRTRLLACQNPACPKGTFAERFPGLAVPRARKSVPLTRMLAAAAVALAARAGARLARVLLAAEVSRHLLVRLVMAMPDPPAGLVRVLGVDDFSLRKGQSYATVLVDMEAGVPVDVLPDREAATLEAWLREHPGTEVICRDRAGAYAEAASAGAPQAEQVADRWHLWHNLCEYAGKAAARHQACPAAGGCAGQGRPPQQQQEQQEQEQEQEEQEQQQQEQQQQEEEGGVPAGLEAVIGERHRQVHQLRAAGGSLQDAAAALGLGRQVTGRYWRAGSAGELLQARGSSALDPYKPYLRRRLDQGRPKIRTLHEEITARGFAGSYSTTYAWCSLLSLASPPRPPAAPAKRQVTRWLLTDPANLDDDGRAALAAILARCPELDALAGHISAFAALLTRRPGTARLDDWLDAATASGIPELRSFAAGIRKDRDAVANAVTLPWNSGRVEGLNTRTKLLKRQGYGRASFPLLRKRILLAS